MENKRRREEEAEPLESLPAEAKRLRSAAILEILDGDDGEPFEASDDLATVMRSLEQEIALADPAPAPPLLPPPELGYLLEASDDDLGIPPPPAADQVGRSEELEAAAALWFADDEMSSVYCYDELGFGFVRYGEDGGVTLEDEEGVAFDGAPFDYA